MPRHQNVTARSSLMCSDDMQMPSTPTFTMSSFLVRAFSTQWTVRADDDDMCYDFAPVDPGGRQFCLGPSGLTHSLNSQANLTKVNRDCSLTLMHPKQNICRQPADAPPHPIGKNNLLSSLRTAG